MKFTEIKSNSILSNNFILKPNYHMNYGKKRIESSAYKGLQFDTLSNVTASIFTGGIFKRVFVEDKEYGYPYISATHMMNTNPLDVAKLISKKYTPRLEEMTLKTNQILVSCAGTIGNVRLITSDLSHVVGSQDIIRVNSDNTKMPYGYIYAYLASKTAYNFMQSYIYGSVVPRIEPKTLGNLPVPILPEEKQQQIHQLIVDSANLRVEANKLLKEAVELMESQLNNNTVTKGIQHQKISSKSFYYLHKRFDAQYQVMWKAIKDNYSDIEYKKIGDFAENIFVGNRGKRHYVNEGIPFLSSSDMMLFNPLRNSKQISKNSPGLESMKVQKKDILISRSGTVGNTVIVGDYLNNVAISEHALRLRIDSKLISPNYVFTYLKTKVGLKAMEASAFGSVIITLNEELIADIDLPILSKDIALNIDNLIDDYLIKLDSSTDKENQAINLIEKEIDAWQ